MCGSRVSEQRLQACGVLNSLRQSEWIGLAEELAELSTADFDRIMETFRIYREAIQAERLVQLPARKERRSEAALRPIHSDDKFELALVTRFPGRRDIQDCARLHFYRGFEPTVESYENISDDERDQLNNFLEFLDEQETWSAQTTPSHTFPNSRLEQILQEQLSDDRLREFARVNWYDGYEAKVSAEGTTPKEIERVFAILRSFERMLKET